ncbi:DUF3558 domain-containing protein [Amycolatopsis magusensis]|uniref:DUF3558 domain-containing protein n=1 Tax=Amycolatopsis magusensis TaxID=882444 RepID=UPI0037A93E84
MSARRLVLLVLLALPIAGCGSPISGRAIPEPIAAPSATPVIPAPPETGVPKVKQPLDVSKYLADPCSSLTATQQAEFNVSSSRINDHDFGVSCIWNVGSGRTSPGVSYLTDVPNGLGNIYAQHDAGWLGEGYFEPTEVDGYPAVYAALVDFRAKGDCKLLVAVSDQVFFESSMVTPATNDACLGAKNVAEAILQTIKEGA